MAVAAFVIPHGAARRSARSVLPRHKAPVILFPRSQHGKFQIAQRLAHIAAAAFRQQLQRALLGAHRHTLIGKAAQGVFQPLQNVRVRKRLELEHRRAR